MKKKRTNLKRKSGRLTTALAFVTMLSCMFVTSAQDIYHPISNGCLWSVSNEKYRTSGDTVLDGKTYLKLYRQVGDQPFEFNLEDAEYFAAIRNDTAGKKVFCYLPAGTQIWDHNQGQHAIDSGMEVVLYDFSPHLGDNFSYFSICHSSFCSAMEIYAYRSETAYVTEGYENGQSHYTVYEDSDSLITMSDGTTRKRILLNTDGPRFEEVWIEGIGRLNGFEDYSISEAEFPFKMLLCYSDSMGASYQTGYDFDDFDDCFSYSQGGGDVPERAKMGVKVRPNPTDDLLFVELSGAEIANMALYDLQGRMVAGIHAGTPQPGATATLDVKSLPAGVYVLRVTDTDGREHLRKVVKK